jgi:hypothetical protein
MTKKRARAVTSGFVLVVAVSFVIASVWQIFAATFTRAPVALSKTPDEAACSAALGKLETALDRASTQTARTQDAFSRGLAPEWNDTSSAETTCEKTSRGKDAWVSLLRLKHGLEGRSQKDVRDIEPLRRDFDARLP